MIGNFESRVYQTIKRIPEGKVLTYKEVAERLGNAKLSRAVGSALNKNRDRKVPCHRVIRSDGNVGGYNRSSREKIRLLRAEGIKIKN